MRETQQHDRNKNGRHPNQKLSTRIDLTPMVDLGFLLITFFIFSTTMRQPNGMRIVVPADFDNHSETAESKSLSLVLDENDVVHYYHGLDLAGLKTTNYSVSGLRAIIRRKILHVQQRSGKNEAVILIKPTDLATYRNVVMVLDEMRINDVKKYVLMEASPAEKSL